MDSRIFHFLPNPVLINTKSSSSEIPSHTLQLHLPHQRRRPVEVRCTNGSANNSNGGRTSNNEAPATVTPPETVEIRFKRGSRRRKQLQEAGFSNPKGKAAAAAADPTPAPKKWEEMSIIEKATELYVGEKGLLFWLNKFAYASIFIVIGAWVLFRFVGPAFNLYQLDSPPLSPTSMFKGS